MWWRTPELFSQVIAVPAATVRVVGSNVAARAQKVFAAQTAAPPVPGSPYPPPELVPPPPAVLLLGPVLPPPPPHATAKESAARAELNRRILLGIV
jgi:hypothetical protein